ETGDGQHGALIRQHDRLRSAGSADGLTGEVDAARCEDHGRMIDDGNSDSLRVVGLIWIRLIGRDGCSVRQRASCCWVDDERNGSRRALSEGPEGATDGYGARALAGRRGNES